MRRLLLILLSIASCLLYAQRVTITFDNTSLAEALRQIDHAQQDKHLVFVFNDLESLYITQNIQRKDAIDAVRQVCQGHPILITEVEDNIFIEYIKPPMHLLPVVSVSGRQIKFDDAGYTIATNVTGLGITDLLASQPNITMRDGIYFNADWKIGDLNIETGLTPQWQRRSLATFDDYGIATRLSDDRLSEIKVCPQVRFFMPWGSNRQHNLNLCFRQEMEEMPYALFSPTVRWSDANNFSIANYYLQSPKTTSFMAHASLWRSRLLVTASYRNVRNEIYWATHQITEQSNMFYTEAVNIAETQLVGLQAECNLQPTSWWQFKLNAQWNLRIEDAILSDCRYKGNHLQQYYTCINQFRFPKNWSITLNGFYQPSFKTYDREYRNTYSARGEILKSFRNNRYQLAIVGQPWHHNREVIRKGDSYQVNYAYLNSIQTIGFRFVYNFRGKTHVKVGTVEGGLKYNDIKDNSL